MILDIFPLINTRIDQDWSIFDEQLWFHFGMISHIIHYHLCYTRTLFYMHFPLEIKYLLGCCTRCASVVCYSLSLRFGHVGVHYFTIFYCYWLWYGWAVLILIRFEHSTQRTSSPFCGHQPRTSQRLVWAGHMSWALSCAMFILFIETQIFIKYFYFLW